MEKRPETFRTVDDFVSVGDPEYYQRVVGKCEMDALVDKKESLDRVYLKLKHDLWLAKTPELAGQLTMSKDSFGEIVENWLFGNVPWPATTFLRRVHALLESGLVQVWKEWIYRVKTLRFELQNGEDSEYKAVSLDGNIRALFFLYLAIALVPIVAFFVEEKNNFVEAVANTKRKNLEWIRKTTVIAM